MPDFEGGGVQKTTREERVMDNLKNDTAPVSGNADRWICRAPHCGHSNPASACWCEMCSEPRPEAVTFQRPETGEEPAAKGDGAK